MGWFQEILDATAGAPWFWWVVALVLLVGLLLLGMKMLGMFPE